MKICIVCSGNFKKSRLSFYQSAIYELAKETENRGHTIDFFLIKGKGYLGYLSNRKKLQKFINSKNYDLIHAHYGLAALLLSISISRPFIVTFHGSDINKLYQMVLSIIPSILSKKNIFVSNRLLNKFVLSSMKKNIVLPCGVNTKLFYPTSKFAARKQLNLDLNKKIVLFSSSFDNPVKNLKLAKQVLDLLKKDVIFIEANNIEREDMSILLNAVDVLLITSFYEGSPQISKEAMACNCPIVSVDVGDISIQIKGVKNSFVVKRDPKLLADKINLIFNNNLQSDGYDIIKKYDIVNIANELEKIYLSI